MNLLQDIPAISQSVWPYDTWKSPDTSHPSTFHKFRCFVLCPFQRADIVMHFARHAAAQVAPHFGCEIEVTYAGQFAGPGTIHADIWAHIRQADIILADLTGHNANVLYELGVAAAWRPRDTVIIVRDESDGLKMAFDLQPARQRLYDSRSQGWMDQLEWWLVRDMAHCLAALPFRDEPVPLASLPLEHNFEDGGDMPVLWTPGPGHRCIRNGALEFGSLYFQYSWLSPAGIRSRNVRVQADMRFAWRPDSSSCWLGIALRSQGYLANHEHLAWLSSDGTTWRTGPGHSVRDKDEHKVGALPGFDPSGVEYIPFDIRMDSNVWSIRIGDVQNDIPLTALPHVLGRGRILLQTRNCLAALKKIRIEEI
jgi:hypothetical protein